MPTWLGSLQDHISPHLAAQTCGGCLDCLSGKVSRDGPPPLLEEQRVQPLLLSIQSRFPVSNRHDLQRPGAH